MNTETITVHPKNDGFEIVVQHDQTGSAYGIDLSKDAYEQLRIGGVGVTLPTKDEVVSEGYRVAKNADYNYRRVLKDQDHDIYYSGWMDCFDWISKGN